MIKMFFVALLFILIPSTANADVLFPDPTGDDLNSSYEKTGKTKLENQVKEGDPSAEYMMGMIYLSGDDRWGIDSNKKKALSLLENAWEAGVMDAGYTLSTMYYKGQSVDKNFCKVENLLLKSGKGGYIKSQRALGRAYKGEVLQDVFNKNIEQSILWFKKAAKNGDQLSAASLSIIYRDGDGVKRNDKLSFEWKKKAASVKYGNSHLVQFLKLAEFYEEGVGTDKNLVKAYKYFDLSGTAGAEGKQRVAKEMTQEQIDEAIRQSQAWQKEHNIKIGGGFI